MEPKAEILEYQQGDAPRRQAHSVWYRGEHCNWLADKTNLREPDAIYKYILKGWLPNQPFIEKAKTRITAFGSCFAKYVTRFLYNNGYKVAAPSMDDGGTARAHVIAQGEGLVNSYAVLGQFEWAWENKVPKEDIWHGWEGELCEPDPEVQESTRYLFNNTDVFIITLGLSEVWYNKVTGEAFWRAVPSAQFDPERHGFKVASTEDNYSNIWRICHLIHKNRPDAKVIFTVSPVPLIATFRPVSCATANSVSKANLRSAVDQLMRYVEVASPWGGKIFYWPSYEIVTNWVDLAPGIKGISELKSQAYEEDNRHVEQYVINTIMREFHRCYCKR
jgi:hypothetical protein